MKMTLSTVKLPVLAGLASVVALSGCATSTPVAYRVTDSRETRIVNPVRIEVGPARAGRYRSLEPVAERVYFREPAIRRAPFTNFEYRQTGWQEEIIDGHGMNTPLDPDGFPR